MDKKERNLILKLHSYKCDECGILKSDEYYKTHEGKIVIVDHFTKHWALRHGYAVKKVMLSVLDRNTVLCASHVKLHALNNGSKRGKNKPKPLIFEDIKPTDSKLNFHENEQCSALIITLKKIAGIDLNIHVARYVIHELSKVSNQINK